MPKELQKHIITLVFMYAIYLPIAFSPFFGITEYPIIGGLQGLTLFFPLIPLSPWLDTSYDNTWWFATIFWTLLVLEPIILYLIYLFIRSFGNEKR